MGVGIGGSMVHLTVRGYVYDTQTGDPVPLATVTIQGRQTWTSVDGSYSLSGIRSEKGREITATAFAKGYQIQRLPVVGDPKHSILIDFHLEPAPHTNFGTMYVHLNLLNARPSRTIASLECTFASRTVMPLAMSEPLDPYIAGEYLVSVDPHRPALNALVQMGGEVVRRIGSQDLYLIRFPDVAHMDRTLELYRVDGVRFVERNMRISTLSVPNDACYSQQWSLPMISLEEAWGITRKTGPVVVAVLDTGIRTDHPDLDPERFVPGVSFVGGDKSRGDVNDWNGHGTHVAGIIGAWTHNGIGIAGIDPQVKLMPVRVLNSEGKGDLATVAQGIGWAVENGAHIINMSLGMSLLTAQSNTLGEAIASAAAAGVILVAAAGNDDAAQLRAPANNPHVIAVGAVNSQKVRSAQSNYGEGLDIMAPGSSILSTYTAPDYHRLSGTSMAAPHVTGVISLMYAQGMTDAEEIRRILKNTAETIGPADEYGAGLINAHAAVTGAEITKAVVGMFAPDGTQLGTLASVSDERVAIVQSPVIDEAWLLGWIDTDHNGTLSRGDYAAVVPVEIVEGIGRVRQLDLVLESELRVEDRRLIEDLIGGL